MVRFYLSISALFLCFCSALQAQDKITFSEGIGGELDSQRRGPVVSASATILKDQRITKILADAYMTNDEFAKYPIRFDFYVNRTLLSSQIRSTELPGPIALDVSYDEATPPFHYGLIATVLHPNRHFTSILYGLASEVQPTAAPEPSGKIDCNVSVTSGDTTEDYKGQGLTVSTSDGNISIKYDSKDSTGKAVSVELALTPSSDKTAAGGTVIVTPQGGTAGTTQVNGTVTYTSDQVSELAVTDSADSVSADCCSDGSCLL